MPLPFRRRQAAYQADRDRHCARPEHRAVPAPAPVGDVIVQCARWRLRYPLAYEHASELLAERGVEVHSSCIWRQPRWQ